MSTTYVFDVERTLFTVSVKGCQIAAFTSMQDARAYAEQCKVEGFDPLIGTREMWVPEQDLDFFEKFAIWG